MDDVGAPLRVAGVGLLGLVLAVVGLHPAQAAQETGPRLTVTAAQAARALDCTGPITRTGRPPILLVHGTTSNPEADWSWNWVRELDRRGWPHCEVSLPDSGNADVQTGAEHVVRAIRSMSARAGGRRIDVVGHSQGGMVPRWALKYWPDTRAKVDDLVGLASSNYGTQVFDVQCLVGVCSAASWQQRTTSGFLAALNDGPDTWPGVSYTQVGTVYDEIVVPYTSTSLRAPAGDARVTNTTVQAVCPSEVVEHFGMSASQGAWLVGLDALVHPGPARPSRIPRSGCSSLFMPGVRTERFALDAAAALVQTARSSLTTPQLPAEPPLRRYAR